MMPMRGNTTAIDVQMLRMQWSSHSSMASICMFWTVSRDQLIRLRDVYQLPKRHDRRARKKPEREPEPSRAEQRASKATLNLAPKVAKRAAMVQATWSDATRQARHWHKPTLFIVPPAGIDIEPEPESE